jgi:hypothetical protein
VKKNTIRFWLVFAIFVAAMICFLCSCDPGTPGGPILAIPCREGDTIEIEITDRTQFIPFVGEYWLSSFTPLDLDKNGVVDFKDFSEAMR